MKIFQKIILLVIIIYFFTSCKKNEFEVISSEIKILSKSELKALNITDKYFNAFMTQPAYEIDGLDSKYTLDKSVEGVMFKLKKFSKQEYPKYKGTSRIKNEAEVYLNEIETEIGYGNLDDYFDNKEKYGLQSLNPMPPFLKALQNELKKYNEELKAISKIREVYDREFEAGSKRVIEKEKEKFLDSGIKGVNSKFNIKNNTNEVIESSFLTVRIIYKFNNQEYSYLKPYKLLGEDKNWKPNESLYLNLNDIATFAIGNTKALNIHTPKNVKIEFYLTAKNSVDYQNIEKNIKELRENEFYNVKEFTFGKLLEKGLNKKQISGLGQKMFDKDITDLWND